MFTVIDRIKSDNGYKIRLDFFNQIVLNEHDGIEILVKILRIIEEYEFYLPKGLAEFDLSLDSYNGKWFHANLHQSLMVFDFYVGNKAVLLNDIYALKKSINLFLTKYYGAGVIDFSNIDSMFLEQVLGVDLPYIENAFIERLNLSDLRNFDIVRKEGINIKEGRYFKQIQSGSYVNFPNHINNHLNETNEDRTKRIYSLMNEGVYGNNGKYIILYNSSNVIRDGEHRAAALLSIFGDIKVSILRILFSHNFYSYKLFYNGGD